MKRTRDLDIARRRLAREIGTIRKDWGGRLPVALCYPNTYSVAMSSLGFQALYQHFNAHPRVVCERVFAEPPAVGSEEWDLEDWSGPGRAVLTPEARAPLIQPRPLSLESGRPLDEFACVAFSLAFEMDYFNVVALLRRAGIPPLATERGPEHPLVIAGGACLTANPEPMAPIMDAIVIGEAEPALPAIINALHEPDRDRQLAALAAIPGVYVPAYYEISSNANGTIHHLRIRNGAALPIQRLYAPHCDQFDTTTVVITPDTELGDLFLIEITRGCGRGCRFCLAGYTMRPVRHRTVQQIVESARRALPHRQRMGLIAATAADHPDLEAVLGELLDLGAQISLSSLRINPLERYIVEALAKSGTKNITLAPEGGSQRMRDIIYKEITHQHIMDAARLVGEARIPKVKMYFMVGLPHERDEDIEELIKLVAEVRQEVRGRNPGARSAITLSPFIPKAQTAFQWEAMAPLPLIEERIQRVKRALRPLGVDVRHDSPQLAAVQAVLARGDRRVARAILATRSLRDWDRAMASAGLDPALYLGSYDAESAVMAWSHVASGVPDWFLQFEKQRAESEAGLRAPVGPPPRATRRESALQLLQIGGLRST